MRIIIRCASASAGNETANEMVTRLGHQYGLMPKWSPSLVTNLVFSQYFKKIGWEIHPGSISNRLLLAPISAESAEELVDVGVDTRVQQNHGSVEEEKYSEILLFA